MEGRRPCREGVGPGSGRLPSSFSWLESSQARVWPEMRISHAQQQRRKSLLLQKLQITLNPIPASAERLLTSKATGCPENKLLPMQHLPHLGSWCLAEGADTPETPHPARAASPLANKTLAALRNDGGFIRYLCDTHLAVRVAERFGVYLFSFSKLPEKSSCCRPSKQPPTHMAPVQSCLGVGGR